MRLPNNRPCMSVNAATTVSMEPAWASLRSSSSESMPSVRPGPPGRAPSVDWPVTLVVAAMGAPRGLLAAAGYGGTRGGRIRGRLDHVTELVCVDRAHRSLVSVLGAKPPPNPDDEADDQNERRVVERRRGKAAVPRSASDRGRAVQRVHHHHDEQYCATVDPLVFAAKRPRAGPEPGSH